MSDKIILPTADAVITPVLEKLYEKRPNAFQHANLRSGVYWHPVLGYRAQAAKMLQRAALLAAGRRLSTGTGQALRDYVASEYSAVPDTGKTFAVGHLTVGRPAVSPLPGGTIPKGTRITRTEFTALGVTFPTAAYETLTDAYIAVNSTAQVTIPVRALREGSEANTPLLTASTQHGITLPNIIANTNVAAFQAAGGSDGVDDDYVKAFAKAYSRGQYGPTSAASRLGALSATGVRRALVYDDVPTGSQKILIADSSWGSSSRWAGLVQQSMYDSDLVGFGCKVYVGSVRNKVVAVDASVVLRDATFLTETTEIDTAIHSAVRSYFDNRIDWNVWNASALRGAIARCHTKVFSCPSVTVKDVSDGSALAEILTPNYSTEQFHYYVASNAMKITYLGPS